MFKYTDLCLFYPDIFTRFYSIYVKLKHKRHIIRFSLKHHTNILMQKSLKVPKRFNFNYNDKPEN